jgi:hypothetical protein
MNLSLYLEQIIEEGIKACQGSILGKIITEKPIHVSSIHNGLDSIWGFPAGLKIQEIERKILQFFMQNSADQERILQGNPWIFRNSWLVLKPWDREIDPRTLDFDHVPVWIQLWGLPHHCKTKAMGRHLGSLMGEVENSEVYEYPEKKIIIKIKVAINVHKPIQSGIHVGNPTDGTCWVDFRYEKLPQFCFNCGLIGHAANLCRNQALNMETLAPLGPWIRSTQFAKRKIDEKDRKFYSNPSHSPNFGQYSPTVPATLLEKLAAMKLQTQNPSSKQMNDNMGHKDTSHACNSSTNTVNTVQVCVVNREYMHTEGQMGNNQLASNDGKHKEQSSNQAKRLRLDFEANNGDTNMEEDQLMAGLEFQASQRP